MMGYDRISELPESLITHILLCLPTQDSVKTSVLSTRWRNLWLNVPGLELCSKDFPPGYKDIMKYFTTRFLEFNSEHCLQKFMVKKDHFRKNLRSDILKDWVATAVDRRIQHLDVQAMHALYVKDIMPHNIYSCKTLVSLKLANVRLENPEFAVFLPCLKTMHLLDIAYNFDGLLITEKLIAGSPVLEYLLLVTKYYDYEFDYLKNLPLLRVRSQTLKSFRLKNVCRMGSEDLSVEIDAPGIEYMCLTDRISDRIVVKNLNSLVNIKLYADFNVKLTLGISNVRHMIISQRTLEVLYQYSKVGPFPIFHNLTHLQAVFSSSPLQMLPAFLESCPNLKNLILHFHVSTGPEQINLTNVPRCLSSTLECVEIHKLTIKEETGIKLVNYFLENSTVLKKLTFFRFAYLISLRILYLMGLKVQDYPTFLAMIYS